MPQVLESKSSSARIERRQFQGVVVGVSTQKTAQVLVKTVKTHAKYRKQYTTSKKYPVHDEGSQAKVGDVVVCTECRPLSKTKRWRLLKIVSK